MRYLSLFVVIGLLFWAGIIFLPPWNPQAVVYVVSITVLLVALMILDEILLHRKGRD
jgi:hypothetical protein